MAARPTVTRPRPLVAAAALTLLALAAGCAGPRSRAEQSDRLVAGLEGDGWRRVESDRVFSPQTLYEEIDGEAELFLPYAFRDLRVSLVAPAARPAVQIRVERFRHGTARDAFGIFSQHRFPGQETAAVGAADAIVSETSLDFFRGTSFVRIRATSRGANRDDLLELGRRVFGLLDGESTPPREAEALLVEGVDPRTVVYHKRAILGFEALAPGFEAKVPAGGPPCTLLILPPDPENSKAKTVESVTKGLPAVSPPGSRLHGAVLPLGTLWLARSGEYWCGVAGKLTEDEALLRIREIGNRLEGGGAKPPAR